MFCILKKKKYVLPIFKKSIQIVKKKKILSIIPNEEKEGLHYLVGKKLSALLRGITSKQHGDFLCLNLFATKKKT